MLVDDFLSSKAVSSPITARNYKGSFHVFEKLTGMSVEDAVVKIKAGQEDPYKVLERFVIKMKAAGQAPKSIRARESAVRSLFAYCDIEISSQKLKAKVPRIKNYTITDDRSPTLEELQKVMLEGTFAARVTVSFMASSGLRRSEATKLKVKDLAFLGKGRPLKITLPAEITKTGHKRVTFASPEAALLIAELLGERIKRPSDPIFVKRRQNEKGQWIISGIGGDALYEIVQRAFEAVGINSKDAKGRNVLHIHKLRAYFRTNLGLHGIPDSLVKYWMTGSGTLSTDSAYFRAEGLELYEKACSEGIFDFLGKQGDPKLRKRLEEMDSFKDIARELLSDKIADLQRHLEGESELPALKEGSGWKEEHEKRVADLARLKKQLATISGSPAIERFH